MKRLCAFWILCLLLPLHAAVDTITVDLAVSTLRTLPVGVVPFTQAQGDWSRLEEAPHQTVERDLKLSGRFDPVTASQYDLLKFSKEQAKYYITGSLTKAGPGKAKLECKLLATSSKELVLGSSYTVPVEDVRTSLHQFMDKVVYQLWAVRGVASTKMAWVTRIEGKKQVVMADYDGFNRRQVTAHNSINTMPAWSADNSKINFTSFRNGQPQLHEKDLASGKVRALFPQLGQTFSPAVNPVSGELLFAVTGDAGTDIWLGSSSSGKVERLSFHRSSETSPAWSPFGGEILFSSDRGGGPQIYVMSRDGSDMRRVTYMGKYNEGAVWSPEGDRIAYSSMDGNNLNIYTCAIDGSDIVQLTNAGNNEHPSWSPDGMLLAFSSNREGSSQIYIMRKDGSGVTRITKGGDNTSPVWSYYYPEVKSNETTKTEGNK
jgi:TolB protein